MPPAAVASSYSHFRNKFEAHLFQLGISGECGLSHRQKLVQVELEYDTGGRVAHEVLSFLQNEASISEELIVIYTLELLGT